MASDCLSCVIGSFVTHPQLPFLLLSIVGLSFLASGLVRLVLHYAKYDARKANRVFWILWVALAVLLLLYIVAFFHRCALETPAV